MNILSRPISSLIPKRIKAFFGPWLSPYESANVSNKRAPIWGNPRDGKEDLRNMTRRELVKRQRYLSKNSGFARQSRSDMQIYSVGSGLTPESQCDDIEMREVYQQYFASWAARCEITNRFSFAEVQTLVCGALEDDGEIFVVRARDRFKRAKLQIIESHRVVDSPDTAMNDGILLDEYGAFAGINVLKDDGQQEPIAADAVMHVFEPERSSLVRNAPTNQHGINHLLDEIEILALEKHAVKVTSDIARVLKVEDPSADEDEDEASTLLGSAFGGAPTECEYVDRIIGGKTVRIKTNESLDAFESNRPNSAFSGFIEALQRNAAGGGAPYEFTGDPSKIGGAVVRLIVGKADRRFTYRQGVLEKRLLTPTWGYVIADGIARGEIKAVAGWDRVQWQTPARVTVDAGRNDMTRLAEVATGTVNISEDLAERGRSFSQHIATRVSEAKALTAAAEKEGVPLWMLYCPTVAANIFAAIETAGEGDENPADDTKTKPPAKQKLTPAKK